MVAKTGRAAATKKTPKARVMANMAVHPSVNAAAVMLSYTKPLGEQDLLALVDSLSADVGDLRAGDMTRAEEMLFGQAHALQSMFMTLARRAANQKYLTQWEVLLRMAMKAQNQCRMTLETLATIQNPPVVFARQANINNGGQQQVNNGAAPQSGATPTPAHAGEKTSQPNKLLEADDGKRMDFGAQSRTGRANQDLATVGAVDRTDHSRREGPRRPKRVERGGPPDAA